MASYDQGYEDDRFENAVSENFHCPICLNVLKDSMMCQRNQHCFCRPCITRHLTNSQTCPTCMEELTVETLKPAPRIYQVYLSELNIHCDYFKRGCREFVQLGNLETHVKYCGFSPVVCSNEGCLVAINKRDRTLHETEVCQFRKVKCHDCSKLSKDMDEMKTNVIYNMTTLTEKLEEVERNQTAAKNEIQEMKMKMATVIDHVGEISSEIKRSFHTLKDQLDQFATLPDQTEKLAAVKNEIRDMNIHMTTVEDQIKEMSSEIRSFNAMKDQLNQLATLPDNTHAVQEKMTREVGQSNTDGIENFKCNVMVAGGSAPWKTSNSTEMFNRTGKTWARFQPMKKGRHVASSVVHNSTMIVTGGWTGRGATDSIEAININPVGGHQNWSAFPAKLPCKSYGHSCVVYDGRLIIIGGCDGNEYSDSIHEVLLVPPYTSKFLTTIPQRRWLHGAQLFDGKILICGGTTTFSSCDSVNSVIMYDISRNKCKQMSPLPFAVCRMATVSWGDNVIVLGGADKDDKALDTVVIYNVKTEKPMKYKRKGCVAVVVGNTIVVMGGVDGRGNCLNTVESFGFDHYSWQEHPSMNEGRYLATAVSW